ncbi:MAG: GNAT family N-acetyltransferase [Candidatus Diapherotrites archaeon]
MMKEGSPEIKMRRAKLSDIDAISELAVKLMNGHSKYDLFFYSLKKTAINEFRKYFRKNIKSRNWLVVIAESGGEIAAYALAAIERRSPIYRIGKRCVLHDIYVDDKIRGRGIGRNLFMEVVQFAKKKKIRLLQVKVDEKNKAAIKVYRKFGFKDYDKAMAMKI